MNDAIARIFVFSLIFNIVFPPLAYAFTGFQEDPPGALAIPLEYEDLLNAGIIFSEAENRTIVYGTYTDFNTSSLDHLRAVWDKPLISPSSLRFYRPSFVERAIGDVTGNYFSLGGEVQTVSVNGEPYTQVLNSTMVAAFDPAHNWTRIDITQAGLIALLTTLPADNNNMTQAVYVTGILMITVGKPMFTGETFDFIRYVEWYWGILTTGQNYGLPVAFQWLLRILAVLFLTSAIMFARELLPIP